MSGTYRYRLTRGIDPTGPRVAFVMLNPSVADEHTDDPTVRRCVGLVRAWGGGVLDVVNLFPYRATHPRDLAAVSYTDLLGVSNDVVIETVVGMADRVVAAWGAVPKRLAWRARDAARTLPAGTVALGFTKGGQPRHPLMLEDEPPVVDLRTREPVPRLLRG
jgi:hypothetical protein